MIFMKLCLFQKQYANKKHIDGYELKMVKKWRVSIKNDIEQQKGCLPKIAASSLCCHKSLPKNLKYK